MEKIKMTTPLVEMDGDEMTRILWKMIKDELILPFVDLKTEYYDLGLVERDRTNDQITWDAANANKKYGVAVKCATITPNKQRMSEYNLKEMWKSPNGTIRSVLDGTVFRAPITISTIKPVVKNWKKPITIARHAYGDVYKGVELRTTEPGTATLTFVGQSGKTESVEVQKLDCGGVFQAMHNKDTSIKSFAHSCFRYAIDTKQDLWFSTKDTISKKYDGAFKQIFEEIYEADYKETFEKMGLEYFYTLIDDAVARVIRSEGGYIWACKNYDGDDKRSGQPRRKIRVRGGSRHRDASLLQVSQRGGNLHKSHGDHFRLDGRIQKARRAGQSAQACRVRRKAGKGLHTDSGGRHYDKGPRQPCGRGRKGKIRQQRNLPQRNPLASGKAACLTKKGAAWRREKQLNLNSKKA